MVGHGWRDYRIPKKPVPISGQFHHDDVNDQNSAQLHPQGLVAGQGTAQVHPHCIYCRGEHAVHLYCSRSNPQRFGMARKKKQRVHESDDKSASSAEGSESSSESESGNSSSDSSSDSSSEEEEEKNEVKADHHGPPSDLAALAKFYAATERPDHREVTCIIHPETVKFYFKKM